MGAISATKLLKVYQNVEKVLAIELLTAAQALHYRKPLRPGRGVELAHDYARSIVPHRERDVSFQEDLRRALQVVRGAEIISAIEQELRPVR